MIEKYACAYLVKIIMILIKLKRLIAMNRIITFYDWRHSFISSKQQTLRALLFIFIEAVFSAPLENSSVFFLRIFIEKGRW